MRSSGSYCSFMRVLQLPPEDALTAAFDRTESLVHAFWKRARQFIILKQFLSVIQLLFTISILVILQFGFAPFVILAISGICILSTIAQAVQLVISPDLKAEKYRLTANDIMHEMNELRSQYYDSASETDRAQAFRLLNEFQRNILNRMYEVDANLNVANQTKKSA
jgi:hypothetical protein